MINLDKAKLEFNNYINKILDKHEYKNKETIKQLEEIKDFANKFIENKVKNK